MSKEHFMYMTNNRPGVSIFIDIIDMGLQNLQSYQHISRRRAAGKSHPDDILLG